MEVLINRLDEEQKKLGWLPEEAIQRIAEEYGVPKAHLYGVISFYSRFYTAPISKYVIRVCKSVSCGMNGSNKIRDAILENLKSEPKGSHLFAVEMVECLGHCDLSPVMTINDMVYGKLTPEEVKEILDEYRKEEAFYERLEDEVRR